jgi:hypothetical protein
VASSKENISDVQSVLKSAQTEVSTLTSDFKDPATASTTQEITTKISAAYDNANKAVQITDTISHEADRKAAEIQTLLGSDNLAQAVDRVKELNLASKDVETISDTAIQQTAPLIPIVEVVKEVIISGTTSSIGIVTSTMNQINSDTMVQTSTINTSSLKTLPLPTPSTTVSTTRSSSSTAPATTTTSTASNTSSKSN